MIRFGPWSTLLGLSELFGLAVAVLLLLTSGRAIANRLLAALMAAASLKLTPYVIGFAGFYDAYPWLSFAPTDFALAFGPLLFVYVRLLTRRDLPTRWLLHFAPQVVDLAYTVWAFALPLSRKRIWNDSVHAPWIDPLETGVTLASLAVYLLLSVRSLGAPRPGAMERRRRGWLLTILAALAAWLAVASGFEVANVVFGLDYFQRFPEYLAFSLIVLALGLEAWRNADATHAPAARDWSAEGDRWSRAIRENGWWREPDLTLGEAARRLGTNESYLSRALNDGLSVSFATLVNTCRVEAVQARLCEPVGGDLLGIAFDSGFASKPSFNRAFKEIAGMSPSEWRRRQKAV